MTRKPMASAVRIRSCKSLRTVVAAAVLTVAASPLSAACLDSNETPKVNPLQLSSVDRAHAMRMLQSEMMVAGLSCGAKSQYNAFATKYKKTLITNGDRLKKHYYAEYGASAGFKKLNTFVTRLANEASIRIAMSGPGYCQIAMERFQTLQAAPTEALEQYSSAYAVALGMELMSPVVVQASATSSDCDETGEKVAQTTE